MKRNNLATLILTIAAVMMVLTVSPAVSQDKPADNMQILRDKIKADKKLIVAANFLDALNGVSVAIVDHAVRWIDCPRVRAAADLKH